MKKFYVSVDNDSVFVLDFLMDDRVFESGSERAAAVFMFHCLNYDRPIASQSVHPSLWMGKT